MVESQQQKIYKLQTMPVQKQNRDALRLHKINSNNGLVGINNTKPKNSSTNYHHSDTRMKTLTECTRNTAVNHQVSYHCFFPQATNLA